jgi:putative FmdB family regulatory protein
MPTYEYRCKTCGEIFERRESIAEHEAAKAKCPKCESEEVVRGFLGLLCEDLQEELNRCRPRPAADGRTGIGKTTVIPAGRRPTEEREA